MFWSGALSAVRQQWTLSQGFVYAVSSSGLVLGARDTRRMYPYPMREEKAGSEEAVCGPLLHLSPNHGLEHLLN